MSDSNEGQVTGREPFYEGRSPVQKYYFRAQGGNFGDDLNIWLWDEILPGMWDPSSNLHFSGIGTILGCSMPNFRHWIICGSGTGYSKPSINIQSEDVFVACVRGPLTATVLGLAPQTALTDGAIMLKSISRFAPLPATKRSGAVFVPHLSAFSAGRWKEAAALAGIRFVDPRGDCQGVIQEIRHSALVLADSLHAAVVADALRVPWIPVLTSPEINQFKWLDWSLSLGVPYEPVVLPASSAVEHWRSRYLSMLLPKPSRGDQVKQAIDSYFAQFGASTKPQSAWRRRHFLLRRKFRSLPKRAFASLRFIPTDERFLHSAAKALQSTAAGTGYLSDNNVSRSKWGEFDSRLRQAAAYAERFETQLLQLPRPARVPFTPAKHGIAPAG